jgi:hypothetical protein
MRSNDFITNKQLTEIFDLMYNTDNSNIKANGRHIRIINKILVNTYIPDEKEFTLSKIQYNVFKDENKIVLFFDYTLRLCLIKTNGRVEVYIRLYDGIHNVDDVTNHINLIAIASLAWLYDMIKERINKKGQLKSDLDPNKFDEYEATAIPWLPYSLLNDTEEMEDYER